MKYDILFNDGELYICYNCDWVEILFYKYWFDEIHRFDLVTSYLV